MHRMPMVEGPPPRPPGAVSPWVEVAAWAVAFALLLAAQCTPDRPSADHDGGRPPVVERRP